MDVPNPFDDGCPNYAKHFEVEFEEAMERFGIHMDYRYQAQMNRSGKYAEYVIQALKKRGEIFDILDSFRTQAAQEGEKFILKISRYLRFRIGPDRILENIVGDYRCLLVEESGFNGNGLFHPFYRRERKAAK